MGGSSVNSCGGCDFRCLSLFRRKSIALVDRICAVGPWPVVEKLISFLYVCWQLKNIGGIWNRGSILRAIGWADMILVTNY